ncbi:MAG: hypothetical protein LBL98_06340 [Ruminococcus sp.]|jgi:hypothetical protein|nr:hypothetical protein [Ruminococcus sp.]
MDFYDEKTAIDGMADFILRGGVSMYNTLKYIYSLAERDFYNVDLKDVIKLVINNVTNVDGLSVLGLRAEGPKVSEMETEEYRRLLPAMVYSLAVRTPALKPVVIGGKPLSDDQIYKIYQAAMSKGGNNTDDIIPETFLEIKYLVKKGKPLPPFTADWYKNYIFAKVPEISSIKNKNIFLLGAADIFFGMFYACFFEALSSQLEEYTA